MFLNDSIILTEFVINGFDTTENPLLIGIILLIVYVTTVLANMINVVFIVCDKRLHKPMYLLICNLAFSDIVHTSSATSTMIMVLLSRQKTISYTACLVQMYIFTSGNIETMLALLIMAFDRLVAVSFPLKYFSYLTNIRTCLLAGSTWLFSFALVSIMPVLVTPLPHCHNQLLYAFCDYAAIVRTTCVDPTFYFNVVTVISSFLIIFSVLFISLSYILIIHFVKFVSLADKKKMGSTCMSHLIVVVCYFSPIFVRTVLSRIGLKLSREQRHNLIISAIMGPSLVHPFIYCFRMKEIRDKIVAIFQLSVAYGRVHICRIKGPTSLERSTQVT